MDDVGAQLDSPLPPFLIFSFQPAFLTPLFGNRISTQISRPLPPFFFSSESPYSSQREPTLTRPNKFCFCLVLVNIISEWSTSFFLVSLLSPDTPSAMIFTSFWQLSW